MGTRQPEAICQSIDFDNSSCHGASMRLDEHTSKTLLTQRGIPVPPGVLMEATARPEAPFPLPWVLKAQLPLGGRGKAGGVRIARSLEEAQRIGQELAQSLIHGHPVSRIRIEPYLSIAHELYFSLTVHRASRRLLATVGRHGGVDIESAPRESLHTEIISPNQGLEAYQIRQLFFHLGLPAALLSPFQEMTRRLLDLFLEERLLTVEINPLAITTDNALLALDAKIELDEHRLPQSALLQAVTASLPEQEGSPHRGMAFHKLSGRIAIMANGAGLAMATMDLLHAHGMPAANFLDLGGAANAQSMAQALRLLLNDPQAEAICINIFGGIVSCAEVASVLITVLKGALPTKPIVVRLAGNAASHGRALLHAAQIANVSAVDSMDEALALLHHLTNTPSPSPEPRSILPPPVPCVCPAIPLPFPVDATTQVLVQGITGKQGQLHTQLMQEYGTQVVAGVTPGKGGATILGVPVYDTVAAACARHRIDASILFVPAPLAPDAILEAVACGIPWIVTITDGIPQQDMLRVLEKTAGRGCRIIGPNCPGLIVPGATKIGIMPAAIFQPGPVAVLSRSGTLTYEVVTRLSAAGLGQRVCIGVGGDPFVGSTFADLAPLLVADPMVRAIVVLGEIGGQAEEELGAFLQKAERPLPLVGFVAGQSAPRGKRLGHAGAILEDNDPSVETKLERMAALGYHSAARLDDIPRLTAALLEGAGSTFQ